MSSRAPRLSRGRLNGGPRPADLQSRTGSVSARSRRTKNGGRDVEAKSITVGGRIARSGARPPYGHRKIATTTTIGTMARAQR
jgi:hypothetical protein